MLLRRRRLPGHTLLWPVSNSSPHRPRRCRENTVEFGVWLAENGDIEEAARRLMVGKAPDVIGRPDHRLVVAASAVSMQIAQRVTAKTRLPPRPALRWSPRSDTSAPAASRSPRPTCPTSSASSSSSSPRTASRSSPASRSTCSTTRSSSRTTSSARPVAPTVPRPTPCSSCTGQRLAHHLDAIEAQLGKPVLAANQVDGVARAGAADLVGDRWEGPGRGLRAPIPATPLERDENVDAQTGFATRRPASLAWPRTSESSGKWAQGHRAGDLVFLQGQTGLMLDGAVVGLHHPGRPDAPGARQHRGSSTAPRWRLAQRRRQNRGVRH